MKAQRKRLYIRGFSNGPYSRLHWVVRVDFGLFLVRVDVETALSRSFLLGVAFSFKLFDFIYSQVLPVCSVALSLTMASVLFLLRCGGKAQPIGTGLFAMHGLAVRTDCDIQTSSTCKKS